MGVELINYGRAAIAEFLGDRIVYRGLEPYDKSLPPLEALRRAAGLAPEVLPRKNEADYARVVMHLLQACQEQDQPGGRIERLVFVGDTRLLDGTAYENLCRVSGWSGRAFICAEDGDPPATRWAAAEQNQPIMLANRWAALAQFDRECAQLGHPIDEGTAVVFDMDKTLVGARGRNARVIDQSRMQAVEQTVGDLLGKDFDPVVFRRIYDPLNQPEFHPFTTDNQDYLAYICLVLGNGLIDFADLTRRIRSDELASFEAFLDEVEARKGALPERLAALHEEIRQRVQAGDPTPFKAFRRNEYLLTRQRFGCLSAAAAMVEMLAEEILITQEARCMAHKWRREGALLFGLSDKPDEASIPDEEHRAQGWTPLHQAETHAVGQAGFEIEQVDRSILVMPQP